MPIAFDTSGQAISWATDHVVIDITAAATGSVVYCAVNVGASQTAITFTGWTQVLFGVQNSANTYSLWRRVKQPGDTQFQASWATTTDYPYAVWASYTGLSSVTPELNASYTDAYATGTNTTLSTNVSSTAAGQWMLVFNTARSSTAGNQPETWTADASLTSRTQGTNNQNKWQILQAADSAGPVAVGAHPYTSTLSAAERYKIAMVVVLNPAASAALTLPASVVTTAGLRRVAGRVFSSSGAASGALAQTSGHTNGILFASTTGWVQDAAGPTGVAYALPVGTANGNLILAAVAVNAPSIVVTPPVGWTRVTGFPTGTSGTTLDVFWRRAAADAGVSYNWSFSAAARWVFSYVQYSGVSGAPVDTVVAAVQSAGGTYPVPTFATTASMAGEWVVAIGLDRASATASVWSANGGTLRLRSTQGNTGGTLPVSMGVFDSAGPVPAGTINSGAVGTALTTNSSIAGDLAAIVIRPVIAAVTVLPGATITASALGRSRTHTLTSFAAAAPKTARGISSAVRGTTATSGVLARQAATAWRMSVATVGRMRAAAGRTIATTAAGTGNQANGRVRILPGTAGAASTLRRATTGTVPGAATATGATRRGAAGTLPPGVATTSAIALHGSGRQLSAVISTGAALVRAAAPRLRTAASGTASAVFNTGYVRAFAGSAASTAVLKRAGTRNLTSIGTAAAALIRSRTQRFTAAAGTQAAVIRAVFGKATATATVTGAATTALAQRLNTTVSATGAAVRGGGRILGSTVGVVARVVRGAGQMGSGSADSDGRLGSTGASRTLAATAASTAKLARAITLLLGSAVTGAAKAIRHAAPVPLTGNAPTAAVLHRAAGSILNTAATASAALHRAAARWAGGTAVTSAATIRGLDAVLAATTATTSMIRRNTRSALSAAAASTGSTGRSANRALAGTATAAGATRRGVATILSTAAAAIGAAMRDVGRHLAAAGRTGATLIETGAARVILTAVSSGTAQAIRAAGRVHSAAATTASTLRRAPGRVLAGTSRADATAATNRGLNTVLSGTAFVVAGLTVTAAASIRRLVVSIGEPFWSWTFGPRARGWRRR